MTQYEANMKPADVTDPARLLVTITFDTAPSAGVMRGVYNGGSAATNIAVTLLDGSAVTIKNVPSGFIFPVFCTKVNTSNTTASASDLLGII